MATDDDGDDDDVDDDDALPLLAFGRHWSQKTNPF